MASTLTPVIFTYKAGAAIEKGRAVKFGADDDHVVKCSAATDKHIGIAQNDCDALNDLCEVAQAGGGKGKAAGTIVRGDMVTADSDGKLVAATSGKFVGQAMASAVAGDIFSVHVKTS